MTERRLTRRGRETRERIVAAAAELIFERGVAETTLEDIRAAAGVSGSQVYHYFEDKQALVRAVIDHQTGRGPGHSGHAPRPPRHRARPAGLA